jgi:hypothetical protein
MLAALARLRRKWMDFYDELTPGGVRCADLPGANILDAFSVVIWPRCERREWRAAIGLAYQIRGSVRLARTLAPPALGL